MLTVRDIGADAIVRLLGRYGLEFRLVDDAAPIPGSFWGEPEAGIAGKAVFARGDTPLHSLLHESCHLICMPAERRADVFRDAGGDDLEEAAVCYLQVRLADELEQAGSVRLMRDMDAWGYSFRLGSTLRWFTDDADDARAWLQRHGLLSAHGRPLFRCRGESTENI